MNFFSDVHVNVSSLGITNLFMIIVELLAELPDAQAYKDNVKLEEVVLQNIMDNTAVELLVPVNIDVSVVVVIDVFDIAILFYHYPNIIADTIA